MTAPAPAPAIPDQSARLAAARAAIAPRIAAAPEIALILGSGLGQLAEAVEGATHIPYAGIPGFPTSTAPGHAGRFVLGRLHGRQVVLMQGRVHLYEGWSAQDIALPVRLMQAMGARSLVITNAAGALDPALKPAAPMLIADHLNFTGANPLTGPNNDALGHRAMACNSVHAFKGLRANSHVEMALAAVLIARVTAMTFAVIHNHQLAWVKGSGQPLMNLIFNAHFFGLPSSISEPID